VYGASRETEVATERKGQGLRESASQKEVRAKGSNRQRTVAERQGGRTATPKGVLSMKGAIVTRERKDGKRYFAVWRVNGKQKWKGFRRRKDAHAHLISVLKRVHEGTYREIKPVTFRLYAEKWLAGLGNLKPSTVASYRSVLEHGLIPVLGDRELVSIGVEDVNAYLSSVQSKLKAKTLRNHLTLLHKLFEDAREGDYLAANRLSGSKALRRPKILREEDEVEVDILDAEEVNRLLDSVDPHYYPLFLTLVSTGTRLGEALGLQWGDLDSGRKTIQIRRTLYRGAYYVPKTKQSRRAIDVGDQLLDTLRGLKRERFGTESAPVDAPIFTMSTGVLIDPDNLRHRIWKPALAKAKLRHVVIHSLRHTFASLLISQGENPKYIQTQLGHSSIKLTMDTYGHLFPREKRHAPARLEGQLMAAREVVRSNSGLTETGGTP
jgi:integrase